MEEELPHSKTPRHSHTSSTTALFVCAILFIASSLFSCHEKVEHVAESISPQDSLPFMHSKGINTLISDSGVMRYRMVAEEWDIYNTGRQPATWKFMKGLLMERFDENFHVDLYIQSDTAYLHQQRTWELRGRVVIRNMRNEVFLTEELFWDMNTHEIWNHAFMRIITPERELQGTEFRSNEQMTRYSVSNSSGAFPVSDTENGTKTDSIVAPPPSNIAEPATASDANAKTSNTGPLKAEEAEMITKSINKAEKATIAKPTKQTPVNPALKTKNK